MSYGYERQRYALLTDTGTGVTTKGDTGPATWGQLMQVVTTTRASDSGDTGLNIRIAIVPQQGEDTGIGFDVLDSADLGVATGRVVYAPRKVVSVNADGSSDTGYAPYILAGDHLRVKATAGRTLSDSGLEQLIYVYIKK